MVSEPPAPLSACAREAMATTETHDARVQQMLQQLLARMEAASEKLSTHLSTMAPTTCLTQVPGHEDGSRRSTTTSSLKKAAPTLVPVPVASPSTPVPTADATIDTADANLVNARRVFEEMPTHQETNIVRVLRVTVSHVLYPVTEEVLHQVFDAYGAEQVVVLERADHVEALVRFQTGREAVRARVVTHGRCIYNGCCWLDVQCMQPTRSDSVVATPTMCSTLGPSHDTDVPMATTTPTAVAVTTSTTSAAATMTSLATGAREAPHEELKELAPKATSEEPKKMVQELCEKILAMQNRRIEGSRDANLDTASNAVEHAGHSLVSLPMRTATVKLSDIIISSPAPPVAVDSVRDRPEDSDDHKVFKQILDKSTVVLWPPSMKMTKRQPCTPPVQVEAVGEGAELRLTPWLAFICYQGDSQSKQPWSSPPFHVEQQKRGGGHLQFKLSIHSALLLLPPWPPPTQTQLVKEQQIMWDPSDYTVQFAKFENSRFCVGVDKKMNYAAVLPWFSKWARFKSRSTDLAATEIATLNSFESRQSRSCLQLLHYEGKLVIYKNEEVNGCYCSNGQIGKDFTMWAFMVQNCRKLLSVYSYKFLTIAQALTPGSKLNQGNAIIEQLTGAITRIVSLCGRYCKECIDWWPMPSQTIVIEGCGLVPLRMFELKPWPPPERKRIGTVNPLASTQEMLFAISRYHYSGHIIAYSNFNVVLLMSIRFGHIRNLVENWKSSCRESTTIHEIFQIKIFRERAWAVVLIAEPVRFKYGKDATRNAPYVKGNAGMQLCEIMAVWPAPDRLCRANSATISLAESLKDGRDEYSINKTTNSKTDAMYLVKLSLVATAPGCDMIMMLESVMSLIYWNEGAPIPCTKLNLRNANVEQWREGIILSSSSPFTQQHSYGFIPIRMAMVKMVSGKCCNQWMDWSTTLQVYMLHLQSNKLPEYGSQEASHFKCKGYLYIEKLPVELLDPYVITRYTEDDAHMVLIGIFFNSREVSWLLSGATLGIIYILHDDGIMPTFSASLLTKDRQWPWDPGGSEVPRWFHLLRDVGLRTSRNLRREECHGLSKHVSWADMHHGQLWSWDWMVARPKKLGSLALH